MSQENVETVRAAHEAVRNNDFSGFLSLIHPEVKFTSLITEADERTSIAATTAFGDGSRQSPPPSRAFGLNPKRSGTWATTWYWRSL
jgi:hypothetical protein